MAESMVDLSEKFAEMMQWVLQIHLQPVCFYKNKNKKTALYATALEVIECWKVNDFREPDTF